MEEDEDIIPENLEEESDNEKRFLEEKAQDADNFNKEEVFEEGFEEERV